METGYLIGDVMNQTVHTIDVGATAQEAAKKMTEVKVGSLVVLHENKPVSIITEQDIARKVVGAGLNAKETTVNHIMADTLHLTEPHLDIYHASVKMNQEKIKHLPVIKESNLLGMISFKDIIQIQPSFIEMIHFNTAKKMENVENPEFVED